MNLLEYFLDTVTNLQNEINNYNDCTLYSLAEQCDNEFQNNYLNYKKYDDLLSHIANVPNSSEETILYLEDFYTKYFQSGSCKLRSAILLSGKSTDLFLENYISDFLNTNDYPKHEHPLLILERAINTLNIYPSPDANEKINVYAGIIERIHKLSLLFEDTYILYE